MILVRLVFYYFAEQIPGKRATRLLNRIGIEISKWTVLRLYRRVRELVQTFMQRQVFQETFRGIIEMDEALFTHRAGPGRRSQRQVWAIGLVERRSGSAFVTVVQNRDHRVINNLIRTQTLPGSLIIHDGWQGYSRIPRPWRHINVNLNSQFTTSQVEGLWGLLRAIIRNMYHGGIIEGNVSVVLTEILWRRNINNNQKNIVQDLMDIFQQNQS